MNFDDRDRLLLDLVAASQIIVVRLKSAAARSLCESANLRFQRPTLCRVRLLNPFAESQAALFTCMSLIAALLVRWNMVLAAAAPAPPRREAGGPGG